MTPSASSPPPGLRVFVVEDDPKMARTIAEVVRSLQHEPHVFDDAESALEEHRLKPAALFIVDWMLPGMDGLSLVRRVRAEGPRHDAVILMLTARNRPGDLARVLDAGATDYLAKPVTDELLRTRLLVAERVVMDRTRRHAAEEERTRIHEALRRSQEDFRQITENAPVGIYIQRADRVIYVNPKMAEITGRPLEVVKDSPVSSKFHPDDLKIYEERKKSWLETGRAEPCEVRLIRADGETIWIEVLPGGTVDFGGKPGAIGIVRDITKARALSAKLHLTDRLASVGTLAAGVAHEVNNPLGFVAANLDVLAERLPALLEPAPEDQRADVMATVQDARDGTNRVQRIVQQLSRFAHADEHDHSVIDVVDSLDAALQLTANELRHRARVIRDVEELPLASGDEARLSQVLVNLLVNAAQALDPARARLNTIRVHAFAAAGRVYVTVEDNGPGISAALQSRIFDPFFTTKAVGEGTGLGLSICHGLITSMGGEIGVDSETGRGTRVSIALEALPNAKRPRAAERTAGAAIGDEAKRRGRVLVIDDEALIGRSLKRALAPHEVVVATTVADAMQLLRRQTFDAILCDLMMPDGGGIDLHRQLEREQPALLPRLSFMTGGAFMPEARKFVETVNAPTFKKPFDLGELRRHLEALIGD